MTYRVLLLHNRYRLAGGEDSVVNTERHLLESRGHPTDIMLRDNRDIADMTAVKLALNTIWSRVAVRDLENKIKGFCPDIVHVHNTFPQLSPAVYWVATASGVPVVQTLHNFRLLCTQAMFIRNGKLCEKCLGHTVWRSVPMRCYHDSVMQSVTVASMVQLHRALGTYRTKVARYIALSEHARSKFVAAGIPAERVEVKPNFVDLPPPRDEVRSSGLYVGRLSEEKGVGVLLKAVQTLPDSKILVIGDGPYWPLLKACPMLKLAGWLEPSAVLEAMTRAAYLVFPSVWFENFPRTLVEAFASGLPVIASRLGAMAEIIEDRVTGLLFQPGSWEELARCIHWAETHPGEIAEMGVRAREVYEKLYSADENYEKLMRIYAAAIGEVSESG